MAANFALPDDLRSQMEATALAEGKILEQWVEEAVRARLEDHKWQALLGCGQRRGAESGVTEERCPTSSANTEKKIAGGSAFGYPRPKDDIEAAQREIASFANQVSPQERSSILP